MSLQYRFNCPECGYKAFASGAPGPGAGGATVACYTCGELYERPAEKGCGADATHVVVRWTHPGRCPRCGGALHRKRTFVKRTFARPRAVRARASA